MGFGAGVGLGGGGTGAGAGAGDGPGDGSGAGDGGFGAGAGAAGLSCRSTTLSGPIVSVTVRSGPEFGAAVNASVDEPCPDAGAIVAHVAFEAAVHRHSSCVRMSIAACPPAAPSEPSGADTSYRHGAASCDTGEDWSLTMTFA